MTAKKARKPRGCLFRLLKRLLQGAGIVLLASLVFSALFIGVRCYGSARPQVRTAAVERASAGLDGYMREEASTFLTLPEWYIVYNTEEYAKFTGARAPSGFPYFGSIRQYWSYYGGVCGATKGAYPFSPGNHVMLAVIGTSFTIEYAAKGLYENVAGRFAEWIGGHDTPEDAFAHKTAAEYGAFMHTVPWYEFRFFGKVAQLWRETPLTGPQLLRKWERKLALTSEYAVKGGYGWVIGASSGAAYGAEDVRIHARIDDVSETAFADGTIRKVKQIGPRSYIVTIPRYEAFTARAKALIAQGVRFLDIAGNDEILVSVLATKAVTLPDNAARLVLDQPLLTDPTRRRLAFAVAVSSLHDVVLRLGKEGAVVEHIYDY